MNIDYYVVTILTSLLLLLIVSNNISLLTDYLMISGITRRKKGNILVSMSIIIGLIIEGYKMRGFTDNLLTRYNDKFFALVILLVIFSLGNIVRLPTSATLSTVGTFIGISLYSGYNIKPTPLLYLSLIWFMSPLSGLLISYFLYKHVLLKASNPALVKGLGVFSTVFLGYTFGANTLGLLYSVGTTDISLNIPLYILAILMGGSLFTAGVGEEISRSVHSYTIKTYASISLATAMIIEVASNLSIPVPLTSLLTITLIGPVLAKKTRFVSTHIFKKTILFWILIPLLSALLSYTTYFLIDTIIASL